MKTVLILGATSAIAKEVARRYAEKGHQLLLVARDGEGLRSASADASLRGATEVRTYLLDAASPDGGVGALDGILSDAGGSVDVALIAYGTLPDQELCESDPGALADAVRVNGTSPVLLASVLAARMAERGSGALAVITSVAGDRGRRSNYVYGSAKRSVSTFLEGLRARYRDHGVHVVDIRPGPVDSPMTAHMEKGLLWTTPSAVAGRIVRAIDGKRSVAYVPRYWRWIMAIIRMIPERIFEKLNL